MSEGRKAIWIGVDHSQMSEVGRAVAGDFPDGGFILHVEEPQSPAKQMHAQQQARARAKKAKKRSTRKASKP